MKAKCPGCGLEFEAPRHDKGAGYAMRWKVLPGRCKEVVAWWISSPLVNNRLTKDEIKKWYNGTTIGGIMGRISELYALDLVSRHEKLKPQYPTITYSLNREKVAKVLNNGGKLKDEKGKRLYL